jgi:DNA-binding NarL/FixJ family response regulator
MSALGRERAEAFGKYQQVLLEYSELIFSSRGAQRQAPIGELTPREREVLTLIASGRSSKEVAEILGIAFKTVACHRNHLLDKLGARNTADLTRAAIRMALIEP